MKTNFTSQQLEDPKLAAAEKAIRSCVHCGFCASTCPTYVLDGNELGSPRGRIYLMQDMLERNAPPTEEVVGHIDRCLSCLACTSTCPSGVNYMHLVDQARAHIETHHKRSRRERWHRSLLATVLVRPRLMRLALAVARATRPLHRLLPARLKVMVELAPQEVAWRWRRGDGAAKAAPVPGAPRRRVAVLAGCVQQVIGARINEATKRVLSRHGVNVMTARPWGCCGSLAHHLGKQGPARAQARAMIDAWIREIDGLGLDAIVITTSGCGVTIKDYPHIFADDPVYADKARRVAAIAKDISEYMTDIGYRPRSVGPLPSVAYHAACSLQHGQKVTEPPRDLLEAAGFEVRDVAEGHLCCGSAGTYNMLQPEIATQLRKRKARNIAATSAKVVASGNIGCIVQLAPALDAPVLHTVELLDWASGGPRPKALGGPS